MIDRTGRGPDRDDFLSGCCFIGGNISSQLALKERSARADATAALESFAPSNRCATRSC